MLSPLLPDATKALRDGETLTFGAVTLDRDGIRRGRWHARWDELSLVRYVPGKLAFFRGQTLVPWRSIRLDAIPPPTVFAKLVTPRAPKVEIDDPLGSLPS